MLSGSIPALITPFVRGGDAVDFSALSALIKMHIREKSNAVIVSGTTGEGPTLSRAEFKEVVEAAIDASNDLIDVIVNSGTNATKESVTRTQIAKDCGAAYALAIVPYYNNPNFTGIYRHFKEITSVGLPVIVYHHPGRTGISLNEEQLVTLHKIEGVVGIKEASSDPALTRLICNLMPTAKIFSGNDDLALDVIECGGIGSMNIIGNVLPCLWGEIMRLATREDIADARSRYKLVKPLIDAINLEINPQGIKCAMGIAGHCENNLRLPLVEASDKISVQIKSALNQLQPYSV